MEQKTFTTILAVLLVAVAVFTLARFTQYYAPTGTQTAVQTNLSINTSCTLSLNLTSSVTGDYRGGNLTWGRTSPNTTNNDNNISVNFSNGGNMPQNISINSSFFFVNDTGSAAGDGRTLHCNQTRYQNWSNSLLSWDAIGATGQGICRGSTVATINRVQENQTYPTNPSRPTERADNNTTFKINIPQGTEPARYHQNITYYAEC